MPGTNRYCQSSGPYRSSCECKRLDYIFIGHTFPACPKCDWVNWNAVPSTIWEGESETPYKYWTLSLPCKLPKDWVGNYIFAKQLPNGEEWAAVKIGEGKLQDRYNCAQQEGCVSDKGATHYHFHTDHEKHKQNRIKEEGDIIDSHPECMKPEGCHDIKR